MRQSVYTQRRELSSWNRLTPRRKDQAEALLTVSTVSAKHRDELERPRRRRHIRTGYPYRMLDIKTLQTAGYFDIFDNSESRSLWLLIPLTSNLGSLYSLSLVQHGGIGIAQPVTIDVCHQGPLGGR